MNPGTALSAERAAVAAIDAKCSLTTSGQTARGTCRHLPATLKSPNLTFASRAQPSAISTVQPRAAASSRISSSNAFQSSGSTIGDHCGTPMGTVIGRGGLSTKAAWREAAFE